VAPIALYPDPLVAQTLMASTYPLEVIEAARFAKASDRARTRCERGKDRIESLHHGVLAADHQAISALAAPDATAGSNIHVVNALLGKVFRAPDIIHVIGIAAVDDNVARRRVREHLIDGRVHGGGRDHQPHRPWRLELLHEIDNRRRANCVGSHQLLDRLGGSVEHHALMTTANSRWTMLAPIRPSPIIPSCTPLTGSFTTHVFDASKML